MAGRILLVEADVVLGAVLEEVLRHSGYEVIFVRTLKGQVERIHSVSAVILDLDIDTTSAEKELACLDVLQPYNESLPIVVMGLQTPEVLHHRLRVHLDRQQAKQLVWVRKPFRNEELLAAVRRVKGSSLTGSVLCGE